VATLKAILYPEPFAALVRPPGAVGVDAPVFSPMNNRRSPAECAGIDEMLVLYSVAELT
jgi:hypothetical protein